MNKDVKLGMEMEKLKNNYYFDSLVEFLKGEKNDCYAFVNLKPLYDEYGYKEVNDLILEVAGQEVKQDE